MKIPRILIAGTHSGVGKTSATAGLCLALQELGLKPQPFKAGPDYIDPGYLTRAAGRPCRNLDTWLVPRPSLTQLFQRACKGADLAVIEGVMGLYDGIGPVGEHGSTAELAKMLNCPVLLVIDAGAVSRSAAAIVRGFVELDRQVQIAGCIVNRLSGPGHYRLVKEAIERLAHVPVVGWLPREDRFHLPERHLGLLPSQENRAWQAVLSALKGKIRELWDLDAVLRIARKAEPVSAQSNPFVLRPTGSVRTARIPIGVALDEAFHFYYPENLELLEELGAEVVPFSPLRDRQLPRGVAALYLGGGFPEEFAPELSRNRSLHQQIRERVGGGLPAYAECGGLMVLARSLSTARGRRYPMVGLVPADVQMTDRLQNFGYQEVRARKGSFLARVGERARGHEFHHSVLRQAPGSATAAYQAEARHGGRPRLEGYARGSLLASYIHLHFWNKPRWAERFVQAARKYSMGRN